MKKSCAVFISILFVLSLNAQDQFYKIPAKEFYPGYVRGEGMHTFHSVNAFPGPKAKTPSLELSCFITLREYREFLAMAKKDSSRAVWKALFPDSTMCLLQVYNRYMGNSAYDPYPVVGVSWRNALNYCRWRTINENKGDTIKFIYRLPTETEWLSAYDHFESIAGSTDMSFDYADWLLNSYDESAYDFTDSLNNYEDYSYWARISEPFVMRRKKIAGSSFRFSRGDLAHNYGYDTEGYRDVGFRMVKVPLVWFDKTRRRPWPIEYDLLELWGLDKKIIVK